jgi:lysophospholipase L1-like esterase
VVSERLGYSLDFLACQGAKIDDLTKCGQMADDALMRRFGYLTDDPDTSQTEADRTNCTLAEVEWGDAQREVAGHGSGEVAGFVPQLRYFEPAAYEQYDVVLVSIGGNDAGFSTIVKSCLLPQDCSDQQDQWAALVRAQRPRLVGLYTHLRELTGPHTKIVAMPYPPLATEEDCDLGLSANEHRFLAEHITLLETEIGAAADEAGIEFFDGTRAAYDGHDLCKGGDAGANHLLLEPTEGPAAKRYQPAFWIHGSMHPNETGHRVLADALADDVTAWADEAVATKAALASGEAMADAVEPPPAEPPVDAVEEMTVEEQQEAELAEAAQALLDDASWITDELYESVTALIAPLLALLGSGVLFAAGFLRKRNPLSNALRPRDAV